MECIFVYYPTHMCKGKVIGCVIIIMDAKIIIDSAHIHTCIHYAQDAGLLRGEGTVYIMLIAHAQTCDHAHFWRGGG